MSDINVKINHSRTIASDAQVNPVKSIVPSYITISNIATLTGGDGISSFTYNGSANKEISVDDTVIRSTGDQQIDGDIALTGSISAFNLSGTNTGDQDLTVLVPYTGATDNINIGNHSLIVGRESTEAQLTISGPSITTFSSNDDDEFVLNHNELDVIVIDNTANVTIDTPNLNVLGDITSTGDIYSDTDKLIATQEWVESQGYITSETDSQTLSFSSETSELSISNGNTVTLEFLPLSGGTIVGDLTLDVPDFSGAGFENNSAITLSVNPTNEGDGSSIDWYWDNTSTVTARIRSNATGDSSSDQLEFYTSESGSLTKTLTLGNITSRLTSNLIVDGDLTVDTDTLYVDSADSRVGIGTTDPSAKLHTLATTEQLRLGYDTSNYFSTTVGSTGATTLSAVGSGAKFAFGANVEVAAAGVAGSTVKIGGVGMTLGFGAGGTSYSGVWCNQATPSFANYTFLGDGNDVFFNAPASGKNYFRTNNGTRMMVDQNGVFIPGVAPNANPTTQQLTVTPSLSTKIGVVVKGAASQTANLQEWQDSNGVVLGSIAASGSLNAASANITGDLTVDTDTLYVDSANNRVGIGTTSLAGSLNISSSGSDTPIVINKANESGVRERLLTATIDGSSKNESFFINNGTIGEGIFAPVFGGYSEDTVRWPLSFNAFTNASGDASDSSEYGIMDFAVMRTTNPNDPLNGVLSSILNRKAFTFRTGSDIALTIRANKNIGIGTTTPEARLHTVGDAIITGDLTVDTNTLYVDSADSYVGIGTDDPSAKLHVAGDAQVDGHFSATTKSFLIDNPNGGKLQYGVVESNEHGVYVRGKTSDSTITLPEHWEWLVDTDSVTVQLTPVGKYQSLYIVSQTHLSVEVGGVEGEYNYTIYGTRKDVEPLKVDI